MAQSSANAPVVITVGPPNPFNPNQPFLEPRDQSANKAFRRGSNMDLSAGPARKRRCTDVVFLLLFIGAWVAVISSGIQAFEKGKPALLTGLIDYKGRVCGYDEAVKEYPFLYFPSRVPLDAMARSRLGARDLIPVCTKECPPSYTVVPREGMCPPGDEAYCTWYGTASQMVLNNFCTFKLNENFVPSPSASKDFCIKRKSANGRKYVASCEDPAADYTEIGESTIPAATTAVHDIYEARWALLCVPVVALIVGCLYLWIVQECAGLFVWGALLSLISLPAFGGYLCWQRMELYQESVDPERADEYKNCAIALWALSGILLLCVMFARKSIKIAVAVLEVAATFTQEVWNALFVPICMTCVALVVFAGWMGISAVLATWVEVLPITNLEESATRFQWDTNVKWMLAANVVTLLWSLYFMSAITTLIIANTVGQWYFAATDRHGAKQGVSIVKAACVAVCYHAGSAALGALLLVAVQAIKIVVYFFTKTTKAATDQASQNVSAAIGCCARCVTGCVEGVLKVVSTQTYIQVALMGKPFCESGFICAGLLVRNIARFALVDRIGDLISFAGVLFISQGCTFGFYVMITKLETFSLGMVKPFWPCVVACLMAFFVAEALLQVFSISADAILQCFMADEEMAHYAGLPVAPHTPLHLLKFVDKHCPRPMIALNGCV